MRAIRPDDFLASKRLPVRHTSFTNAWQRVRNGGLPRAPLPCLLGAPRPPRPCHPGRSQYLDQRPHSLRRRPETVRTADYWASARDTLRQRAGDCEDIAIAKMQLLAGLGVSRSDMYLTIARDLARNADHALLVVRLDDRYWLLDNATDRLLDASEAHDYRPIMSSIQTAMLHGY